MATVHGSGASGGRSGRRCSWTASVGTEPWGIPIAVSILSLVVLWLVGSPVAAQEPPALTLPASAEAFPVGFTSITSVRELEDGRLLVADRSERRLYLLDWATGAAEAVGGVGQGPGEYQGIGWIYPLAGEASLLTEGLFGRWHLLEGARIHSTLGHERFLPGLVGSELGGGSGTGAILAMAAHRGGAPPADRYSADSLLVLLVERVGADGSPTRMDTVAVVPGRGPGRPSVVTRGATPVQTNPLVAETLAVLFADGWVALVLACPFQVRWRTPAGEWVTGEAIEACGPPLDDARKCAAARTWDFRRALEPCSSQELDPYIWPERVPPFLSQGARGMSGRDAPPAHAAPDGRLLVRRLPSPDRLTLENRYDVIDRSGRLSGILRLPANEAIVGVGRNHLFVVSTDQYDLQHLRREPWPTAGSLR